MYGALVLAFCCCTVAIPPSLIISTCKICVVGAYFMTIIRHVIYFYSGNLRKMQRYQPGKIAVSCLAE